MLIRKLVAELLDISRIQTGKLGYHEEAFDVDDLVKEIVRMIFQVPDVRISFNRRSKGKIPARRGARGDALVERSDDDGLPCAAREAGCADTLAIDVGMLAEIVDSFAYCQIEQPCGA